MADDDALSYLEDLGKAQEDIKSPSGPLAVVIKEWGEQTIDEMKKKAPKGSGDLRQSIAFEFKTEKGAIVIDFTANDYWDFINSGVKGTQGGSSKKGYSFSNHAKTSSSGVNFKESIKEWIINKGIKAQDGDYDALAFVIMRAVKRKGIKATNFVDDVLTEGNIEGLQNALFEAYKKLVT